jgi:hypothetical protein
LLGACDIFVPCFWFSYRFDCDFYWCLWNNWLFLHSDIQLYRK